MQKIPVEEMSREQIQKYDQVVQQLNQVASVLSLLNAGESVENIQALKGDFVRRIHSFEWKSRLELRNVIAQKGKFAFVGEFAENGLAVAQDYETQRYYYVDTSGNRVLGSYDLAKKFVGKRAVVRIYGEPQIVIDDKGDSIFDRTFTQCDIQTDGRVMLCANRYLYVVPPNETDYEKYMISEDCRSFTAGDHGTIVVCTNASAFTTFLLLRADGSSIYNYSLSQAHEFREGVAFVQRGGTQYIEAVNLQGECLESLPYSDVESFYNGYALARINGSGVLLDHDFQEATPKYTFISNVSHGRYLAMNAEDSHVSLFDLDGTLVQDLPSYKFFRNEAKDGVFAVRGDGRVWSYIDPDGNPIFYRGQQSV